jgi:hypothetical protein
MGSELIPFLPRLAGINDSYMSKCNQHEANMIVGFFDYLVRNGMEASEITVLTFYNGQRKMILKGLKVIPTCKAVTSRSLLWTLTRARRMALSCFRWCGATTGRTLASSRSKIVFAWLSRGLSAVSTSSETP